MGVLCDMAVSLLVTELVAMELVLLLVEVWANSLREQIVSSLRSFSSLPISQATLTPPSFLIFFPLLSSISLLPLLVLIHKYQEPFRRFYFDNCLKLSIPNQSQGSFLVETQ